MSDIVTERSNGILRVEFNKRLLKLGSIAQVKAAITVENQAFGERVRSAEAKEALSAFLQKRPPNFAKTKTPAAAE